MEASKNTISLKFYPKCKKYILDRQWFPKETKEILKDGSVILTFESDINLRLTRWIKGLGSEVEVLEPEELRSEIIADLRKNLGGER